jgi:hypothetical protein
MRKYFWSYTADGVIEPSGRPPTAKGFAVA